MALIREHFPVGLLQCNCTILGDDASGQAVVIDPGDDSAQIVQRLQGQGLETIYVLHTHAHLDHVGATAEVASATGAKACLHRDDLFLYEDVESQARMIGLPAPPSPPSVDHWLEHDDRVGIDGFDLVVLHTPGHTPGSCCFRLDHPELDQPLLFSGDTLFAMSIGRTDLPGGNSEQILDSIRRFLVPLPAGTFVVPGHGPATTIETERAYNPFLQF